MAGAMSSQCATCGTGSIEGHVWVVYTQSHPDYVVLVKLSTPGGWEVVQILSPHVPFRIMKAPSEYIRMTVSQHHGAWKDHGGWNEPDAIYTCKPDAYLIIHMDPNGPLNINEVTKVQWETRVAQGWGPE